MTAKEQQIVKGLQESGEMPFVLISGRIRQDLFPKVNPAVFQDVLGQKIDLRSYGEGIKKLYFTFIAIELSPHFEDWAGASYDAKEKKADIGIPMDMEELNTADQGEVIQLMEQAFLSGIDAIGEFDLKDLFDWKKLRAQVEAIFADPDWYKEAIAHYSA